MPTWLIWVIVIVVVVVIAAAVFSMAGKRRIEQRRTRAGELRQEATGQAAGLTESQRQAEEARAQAELARAEAERAAERASKAEESHDVEQAGYEDKLREADRLDPSVDHKAPDYEPDIWDDERSESTPTAAPTEATGPTEAAPTTEPTKPTGDTAPKHAAD
jgi:hypothetical protein